MPNKRGGQTRERLLAAAFRVAGEHGPRGLTLEAVAEAAGASKGGLLYHFPTKEALLRAMLEDSLDRFGELVERHVDRDPTTLGRSARAYVESSFEDEPNRGRWTALLTAMFDDPQLAAVWQERAKQWTQVDGEEGVATEDALIARLAVDGLWLRELVGAAPLSAAARKRLRLRLVELTEQPAPPTRRR